MRVDELLLAICAAKELGLPDNAEVCFDTEAGTFDCHLVDLDGASIWPADISPDGKIRLVFTTKYHHGRKSDT